MPVYTIRHSPALHGEAQINTSKNAVLPILAAALLCSSPVTIHRAPRLTDVDHMLRVLTDCGARIERQDRDITIYPAALRQPREPQNLHSLRASILVLGPLCVRLGEAIVPLPGGCAIGQRPVDIHLNGLRAMGAETEQADNCAVARGRLRGANIYLDFPSVGATENLLMAAALADGVTRIENAAKEPEIVDLADFLNLAGAHIVGAGTGTLACAAAITKGSMLLCGVHGEHLRALLFKLREMGLLVQEDARGLCLRGQVRHGADIRTLSYPGFPTDLQAPMMTVACAARGRSVFLETIFENRYMHAISLCRMGADLRTEGRMAVVEGGKPLSGAVVEATDLRAGAALMLAGLIAQGETTLLDEPGHICRGYEGLDEKLRALGADVTIAPLH